MTRDSLTLTRPDDWHLHLRDGERMAAVAGYSARTFARAIIMPNLTPPVDTVKAALAYRERILAAVPANAGFEPLMTLYLTPETAAAEIASARRAGLAAAKLYPAGATTHSASGVSDFTALYPVFGAMEEAGLVLCVHGEVTDPDVDVFDREAVFIERHLADIVERFPGLRVVLEHVTTEQGVEFVRNARDGVGATLTAHHLLHNRNTLLAGGLRPHYYCAPVLKAENHRRALLDAATSGDPKFFLGTDSAPHARADKESACGCAGVFTAHAALPFYARAFESVGALDRLEGFAGRFGAAFYGVSRNEGTVTLTRRGRRIPDTLPLGEAELVPLGAGELLDWQVADPTG